MDGTTTFSEEEFLKHPHTIYLTKEEWDAFIVILNSPPKPSENLKKLLREPSVFEKL